MNRNDVLNDWNSSIASGTFVTGKHESSSIGTIYPKYRTVTVQTQSDIQRYLASGDFVMRHYKNTDYPQSPHYIEVVPNDPSMVPGSGVLAKAPVPTHACDRFVAVSGTTQGWHLYAEQSSTIQSKVASGKLIYLTDL